MNFIKILSLGLLVVLTGCSSKVVTYDTFGRVTGSCIAKASFVLTAPASCYGYSNQDTLTFVEGQIILPTPNEKLPELPQSRKVLLQRF